MCQCLQISASLTLSALFQLAQLKNNTLFKPLNVLQIRFRIHPEGQRNPRACRGVRWSEQAHTHSLYSSSSFFDLSLATQPFNVST